MCLFWITKLLCKIHARQAVSLQKHHKLLFFQQLFLASHANADYSTTKSVANSPERRDKETKRQRDEGTWCCREKVFPVFVSLPQTDWKPIRHFFPPFRHSCAQERRNADRERGSDENGVARQHCPRWFISLHQNDAGQHRDDAAPLGRLNNMF